MINLDKKKPFNLNKEVPGLNHVKVGLSWDPTSAGLSPDADASVFMLDSTGKIPSEGYFVFYNNLTSADGAVVHSGDNRTGEGDGDDEEVTINLSKVSPSIVEIVFVISIHNKDEGFHFGNVLNSSIKVYDLADNSTICQFVLNEPANNFDSLNIGRLFRKGNEWEFEALVQVYEGGLGAAVALYTE